MAAAQLRDKHGLEGLHGGADLAVAALLVEDQREAVRAVAVLFRKDERVEARLHRVLLRAKAQTARQAQLEDRTWGSVGSCNRGVCMRDFER